MRKDIHPPARHTTSSSLLGPICWLLIACCLLLTACSRDNEDATAGAQAEQFMVRAESYRSQGQYRSALIEIKNVLQKDRNNIKAHELMARIFNEIGRGKQVVEQLEPIRDRLTPALRLELAKAYARQNKYHSALDALGTNASVYTQVDNKLSYYLLQHQAYLALKQVDKADQVLEAADALTLSDKAKAEIPLQRASQAMAVDKDAKQAHQHLEAALALNPNLAEAYLFKARLALEDNALELAEEQLTQALINLPQTDIITPQRVSILEGLIRVLTQQGRSSEALVYSKLLADAHPQAEELRRKFEEAVAFYKEGELDKAEKLLLELYNEGGNPDIAGRLLGMISYLRGDMARAQEYLSSHLDPENASSEAIKLLVETQLRTNQLGDALAALKIKLRDDPDNLDLQSLYAMTALTQGERDEGVRMLEQVLQKDPKRAKLYVALAAQYLQTDPAKTLEILQTGFRNNPKDFDVQKALVQQLIRTGQQAEAERQIKQILNAGQPDAQLHGLAGGVYLATGKADEAKRHFAAALKIDPDHKGGRYGLASVAMMEQQWRTAAQQFEAIFQDLPDEVSAYKGYLLAMGNDGKHQQAIDRVAATIEQDANLAIPLGVLSEVYATNGRLEKSLETIQQALVRAPTDPYIKQVALKVYRHQATQAMNERAPDKARVAIMDAIQLDRNNGTLLSMLAELEIAEENYREAEKLIEQIETQYDIPAIASALKGQLLIKQKRLDDALGQFELSWQSKPSDLMALKLYYGYRSAGQIEKANAFLDDWAQKLPNSAERLQTVGMVAQAEGNASAAMTAYEQALGIKPNMPVVLNNLAWLYHERGDKRALPTAEKAYQLATNSSSVTDTYGWILVNQGQVDKGIQLLEKALELAPQDTDIQHHLNEAKKRR